ncbi:MAG: sugar phosphate isomerase/epimerase [Lentisphaerae bacterium]|jgi:sugar phosphate isomerase/epimerase|nr:sugar phosphate isomerase/epimerase [Lentisphaerota bacterium]MBT5606144.1 sugar phosphate isomerase/epimerase [Lentisphaerota bacterium]MBT7056363.1 sugar phosphate isomerase/epimerase [Lentisphaerota bacterium]MBT7842961.1 sugar phosphate isomerase/epimerase [Lentisphaerota bacterium]
MATTFTHSYPIGFRRGGGWQDDLGALIAFAADNGFEHLDLRPATTEDLKRVKSAGLGFGTIDLVDWPALGSADATRRTDAVQTNAELIKAAVAEGAHAFFLVLLPEEPAKPRRDNFGQFVKGLGALCDAIADTDAKLSIEGWPGPAPNFATLACVPADLRALFKEVNSDALGINFDPSHLIRMGINPVRFLDEFAQRVVHVHGKDTELLDDDLYEYGNVQPATFGKNHGFGGFHWRYTIPGRGIGRWGRMLEQLSQAGYSGGISIELEDEDFNGSEEGEKRGLCAARDFLMGI